MTEDERKLEVDRRRFCIATGAALGVSVLPVSKLVAGAQLLDRRRSVGAAELAFAADVATDLASRYAATPTTEVSAAAKAHAYTLAGLLQHATMTPNTRTALTAIASDAACLVAFGYGNAGRLAEADRWFADAHELARQAEDRRLEALVLATSAWIAKHALQPDWDRAVAVLEAAAELQRFLRPGGRAFVFGNLALVRAALGDDLASGRFLEQAWTAAALVPYDEPGWGWWSSHGELSGWDGARPQVYTGVRWLSLGRPAQALDLFDGALDGTTNRRRAVLLEHITDACVALDDPDRASASAHAALDEATMHELGFVPGHIRRARMSFPKEWTVLRPVVELDERLALAR